MFIDRKDGKITGVYARPQYEGQELIADDAEELVLFYNPPKTIDELRRAEYPKTDELDVALWELVVEGRPEAAEALQIKRLIVKERIPKT